MYRMKRFLSTKYGKRKIVQDVMSKGYEKNSKGRNYMIEKYQMCHMYQNQVLTVGFVCIITASTTLSYG